MSIVDTLSRGAGRLAEDVQHSLKRARLEGERRILMRDHRAALEALGARARALAEMGDILGADLAPEIAIVDARAAELATKVAEIDALRTERDEASHDEEKTSGDPAGIGRAPAANGAGAGWDAAAKYFPGNAG